MKMKPSKKLEAGIVTLTFPPGIIVGAQAGGPAILPLPIEGVTAENGHQCAKLFEEKLGR